MLTYNHLTKAYYVEELAGRQAEHSANLMSGRWITPRSVLEARISHLELTLMNWDTLASDNDVSVSLHRPNWSIDLGN